MAARSRKPKWDGQRESLDDLSEAVHYNEWIYRMVLPYLGQRILEIGCGTGNLTGYLGQHGPVLSVDVHEGYLRVARERWGDQKNIRFQKVDLDRDLRSLKKFRPDTLLCVNVLEHISNDGAVLLRCHELLPPVEKSSFSSLPSNSFSDPWTRPTVTIGVIPYRTSKGKWKEPGSK